MFEGQSGTAHHAFQRIVGYVNGQFDFLAEALVEATEQGTAASEV